jgi:hypothetical protein
MQPDLLSAQREEEQAPESLSLQDPMPPETLSAPDPVQREPISVVEAVAVKPAVSAEKKRSGLTIAVIGLVLLVFLLLLSFGWVGFWAYTLNSEFNTAQQQLAVLQAEHAKLQTDYAALTSENEKLNTDLAQSKADLEKANTDLTSAQADLSKSKQEGAKLADQIDAAGKLTEILYVTTTLDEESDILKIDRLINGSKDKELAKQWDTFTGSPSEDAFGAFIEYLVSGIRNSLK